jgi:acetylornithine/LysW-gamma-L-lysine aminotransferase
MSDEVPPARPAGPAARAVERAYTTAGYPDRGLTFVAGEGVHLLDEAGGRWLDLMTNYGVSIFGHGHPRILNALTAQAGRLLSLHGSFANDARAAAARALVARCGGGLARVCFANSGAEAVEAALKFAVLATGRKRFVACAAGFHGKTLGALSATHEPKYRLPFEPLLWEFARVEFGNADALGRALDERTAAFIVEPVLGEGGLRRPPAGFLAAARDLCGESGALLILDEIQSGMGRTGTFLAAGPEAAPFDIVCLGKGLAGGVPIGAAVVSPAVAARIPRGLQTSTFGGNPLAAAGIVAALDLLDEDLLRSVREVGAYFLERLEALAGDRGLEARGAGLMLGLRVPGGRDKVLKALQERKVLAIPAADDVVRFLPPFILKKEHVDFAVRALAEALAGS